MALAIGRLKLAAAVVALVGFSPTEVDANSLNVLRAAYNEDVRRLNAGDIPPMTDVTVMTPEGAVRQYDLGMVDLKNLRQVSELPLLGAKFTVRGRLVVSDPRRWSRWPLRSGSALSDHRQLMAVARSYPLNSHH